MCALAFQKTEISKHKRHVTIITVSIGTNYILNVGRRAHFTILMKQMHAQMHDVAIHHDKQQMGHNHLEKKMSICTKE